MIEVTNEAANWYKKELDLEAGAAVRFFVRYSSGGTIHPGFSLGIQVEQPTTPGYVSRVEGVTFYIEESDLWFLSDHTMKVNYSEALDDIEYVYEQI